MTPSLRDRMVKWLRRNPRAANSSEARWRGRLKTFRSCKRRSMRPTRGSPQVSNGEKVWFGGSYFGRLNGYFTNRESSGSVSFFRNSHDSAVTCFARSAYE